MPLMPTVARGMQFTESEWCYLLAHCGWQVAPVPTPDDAPSLWVRAGLDQLESGFDSSAYLPRKKNSTGGPADVGPFPACKCVGYDFGGSMWNERLNDYARSVADALVFFDWRENMRATKKWAVDHPSDPFGPWMLPGRDDAGLDVAGRAERIGPNPYILGRSPFWRMKANLVPVHDLPVPPRELWVSPLPPSGLKQGDAGSATDALGRAINQLQRRYILEDCWVTKTGTAAGTPNWYYGSDWVRSSMEKHQRRLKDFGLYAGPINGGVFTVEYRTAWDNVLRYDHLYGGN